MSFANGVMQGQQIFEKFHQQFQQGQQKRALDEVADAKPVESTGYTADQGKELEALAAKGYKIDVDQASNAYVARNEAGDTRTVAMQGVTDFMGERTAGSMPREQQDNTRMLAMADVIGRSDPARGIQMRQQVQQGQHAAKRQGREEKQWAREDDVDRIDAQLGDKFKASLVDPEGKPRQATTDDYLANTQERAFALAQGGHMKAADQAMKDHMAQSHIKIQLEAAERKDAAGKAAAAIGAGDYSVAASFYNKYVPSGSKVTSIEAGKDGQLVMNRTGLDGKPIEAMQIKNQGEALAMLRSLEDPMALYQYSQGEFQNMLRLKADKRADGAEVRADRADSRAAAADGRAAASHSASMTDRREVRDVREALAKETDPTMTPTQLRAVRAGILQTPGADTAKAKYDYDPAKVQKAFGETSSDPLTGKETVKRNTGEEQKFAEFMADNASIRDVDEALVRYNRAKVQGGRKEKAVHQERLQKTRSAMTPENLAATAKAHNMSVKEVVEELAKRGVTQ